MCPLQLTPPPSHFLHTQTKAASLGKVLSHLCFCIRPKPCSQADSLVISMSVYKLQSTSASPWRCKMFDLFRITRSKQSARNLAHINMQVKISTRTSKRWSFISHLLNQKGSIHHHLPALIWLFGRSGFPRWVPNCLNKLLVKHVSNAQASSGNPSPHQSSQSVKASVTQEVLQIQGQNQDNILEIKTGQCTSRELRWHNRDLNGLFFF